MSPEPERVADQAELAALSFEGMKGIRYVLRNFTALSVKEHLRSQLEQAGKRGRTDTERSRARALRG
jgi:hypothetical protein